MGEAEDELSVGADIFLGHGGPVEVNLAELAKDTEDVGTGVLAHGRGDAVGIEESNVFDRVITNHVGVLHAPTDELVVSVDDAGHGGVGLCSMFYEDLYSGQGIFGLVVLLPACIRRQWVSRDHNVLFGTEQGTYRGCRSANP